MNEIYEQQTEKKPLAIISAILTALNIILFLLCTFTGDLIYNIGCTGVFFVLPNKEYYRLILSMFLHYDINHLVSNLIILYFMGEMVERVIGKFPFLIIYLISGLGGNIASMVWEFRTQTFTASVGASGAVFGIMGMLLTLVILKSMTKETMDPRRVLIAIVLSLYSGFTNPAINNAAHIGGLVCGFILSFIWVLIRSYFKNKRRHYEN